MPASFTPGQILVSKWGYDQTNISFYKVIRCTDKTVWIREIGARTLESSPGGLWGSKSPDETRWAGEIMRRKNWGNRVYVDSFEIARPWNGSPVRYSDYA